MQELISDDASSLERDEPLGIIERRTVGKKERFVQPAVAMPIVTASTPVVSVAANSSVKSRAPAVGIGITARPGVDPRVRRLAIHLAGYSLVWPAPGEEDSVLRHAIPNLAFAH